MDFNLHDSIIEDLALHLREMTGDSLLAPVYNHTLFPPGKLFRSKLSWAVAFDSSIEYTRDGNHAFFASFLEFHHSYMLIHDDLPCMDNDDWRRGRPSSHKKYGEWKALLAGDGLNIASFGILSQITSPLLPLLFRLATWTLGSKGAIEGQAWDLVENKKDFSSLIHICKLKTARLIQLSLVGSFLLTSSHPPYRSCLNFAKLGYWLGLIFQLLDDLHDLIDESKETNIWIFHYDNCFSLLKKGYEFIDRFTGQGQWPYLCKVIHQYNQEVYRLLSSIKDRRKKDLTPVMLLLKGTRHG